MGNGQRCQDDPSRHLQESNHVQEQVEFDHVSKAPLKELSKYKIIGFRISVPSSQQILEKSPRNGSHI